MIQDAVELVPGKLYRLGGCATIDDRLSWFASGTSGYVPINSYLVVEASEALLIDGNIALFGETVADQLEQCLLPGTRLSIFLSRVEPEVITGLTAIQARHTIDQIYGGGRINPFDYFDSIASSEIIRTEFRTPFDRIAPGSSLFIGTSREVRIIRAPLRLLTTSWAYDVETRSMFTSDSFTQYAVSGPDETPVLSDAGDIAEVAATLEHLLVKFEYLQTAVAQPIRDQFAELIDAYPAIERLAPTYGCVVSTQQAVKKQLEVMQRVLASVGADAQSAVPI